MKVVASGTEEKMLQIAEKHNWAVGKLEAVRFVEAD
jgi:hypothetical protein